MVLLANASAFTPMAYSLPAYATFCVPCSLQLHGTCLLQAPLLSASLTLDRQITVAWFYQHLFNWILCLFSQTHTHTYTIPPCV